MRLELTIRDRALITDRRGGVGGGGARKENCLFMLPW